MKPFLKKFTDTSRDAEILYFVWRWKVSTTSMIAAKFFPKTLPQVAYNKLNLLQRAGFLELQPVPLKMRTYLWHLTKKGFEVTLPYLPSLHEEGFRSECLEHDLLVAACQLGPWLIETPPGVELFSERELRSVAPTSIPEWVPQTTSRRPDGYWKIQYQEKMCVIALEVERQKKVGTKYEIIASFYKDNPSIFRVVWLVPSIGNAQTIMKTFTNEVGAYAQKHNFILLKDFEKNGWQASVVLGLAQGRTLAFVLQHKCALAMPCLCRGTSMVYLNKTGVMMSMQPLNQENSSLLTVAEIAKKLHVSTKTIYYWVHRNEIPFLRIGKHLRFSAQGVVNYFQEKTEELKPACFQAQPLVNKEYSRSLKIGATRSGSFTSLKKE